ncbi:exported hypothetical protein [Rhodococcus sp. RD6.2]|jgi:hypothetical protein|uniref:hypothetical protein n=1 Tax=Rhodococcus sp. RD6.2 TaxID=260936 RepID=UPI00063B5D38|nr:hypothetical protein [Rhodococcus sp. RD6.2]CRK54380.1 exported hypothetical protein [Rhodococcus sp. RD6.2]
MSATHSRILVAAVAIGVLVTSSAVPAQAAHESGDYGVLGGRGRILLTVETETFPVLCDASVIGNGSTVPGPQFSAPAGQVARYRYENVPADNYSVTVLCNDATTDTALNSAGQAQITVSPANPFLDLLDNFLIAVGLGDLASDQTLR